MFDRVPRWLPVAIVAVAGIAVAGYQGVPALVTDEEGPEAAFSVHCEGLRCTFDASTTERGDAVVESYRWTLNGTEREGQNVTQEFDESELVLVELTVEDADGRTDTEQKPIRPDPVEPPEASLSVDCTRTTCKLDATDSRAGSFPIETYRWQLGDGNRTEGQQAEVAYAEPGTYTVTLRTVDATGLTDESETTITVTEGPPPTAVFTSTCDQGTCTFDASPTEPGQAPIEDLMWNLGDDRIRTGEQIEAHYEEAGTYNVTLTVRDARNQTATTQHRITVAVDESPSAAFGIDCLGRSCELNASDSQPGAEPLDTYTWRLPNGTLSGETIEERFPSNGSHVVTLVVTDEQGYADTAQREVTVDEAEPPAAAFGVDCQALNCTLDANASRAGTAPIAEHAWTVEDRPDGAGPVVDARFPQAGTYNVSVRVVDELGHADTATRSIQVVNAAPRAAFVYDCENMICTFDADVAQSGDASIERYAWELGDNATAHGSSVEHRYEQEGIYKVNLTVADGHGLNDTIRMDVPVLEPEPPEPAFTVSCEAKICTFDANATEPGTGNITGYEWRFGDGGEEARVRAEHEFASKGLHEVELTVVDEYRKNATAAQEVLATGSMDGEWPMFGRGPSHRAGQATNGSGTGEERWSTATGGAVAASPAIVDGTAYIGSSSGRVLALDADTGEEVWSFDTGSTVASSPAAADGVVYVGADNGRLYALDAETGRVFWKYNAIHDIRSSPVVHDGTVYVRGTFDVHALDAGTGTLKWETWGVSTQDAYRMASLTYRNDTLYVPGNSEVLAMEPGEGDVRWRYETSGRIATTPAVTNERIYVGTSEGRLHAIHAHDGTRAWSTGAVADDTEGRYPLASSPAVADDLVYIASSPPGSQSGPVGAGTGAEAGDVMALNASSGEIVWSHHARTYSFDWEDEFRTDPSPAVAGDTVYAGLPDGRVYALDADTGEERWNHLGPRSVVSSPAVVDGTVYVGSNDGNLYALDAGQAT